MCTWRFMDIVKLKVQVSTEENKIEISSCKIEFNFQIGHYCKNPNHTLLINENKSIMLKNKERPLIFLNMII